MTQRPIAARLIRRQKLLTAEARRLLAELLHALEHTAWQAGSPRTAGPEFADEKGMQLGCRGPTAARCAHRIGGLSRHLLGDGGARAVRRAAVGSPTLPRRRSMT